MTELASFAQLMREVKEGNPDAAERLVRDYSPYIVRVVRRYLFKALRRKFDSADFVQSVWGSFFRMGAEVRPFAHSGGLIRFLRTLARNKAINELRLRQTLKHNILRELESDDIPVSLDSVKCAAGPTASQAAVGKETWNKIQKMADPEEFDAAEMRVIGMRIKEVATQLGIHEGTVRRILRRLKHKLDAEDNE